MVSERYRYTISPEFDGLASYAWLVEPGSNNNGVGYCVGSSTG